MPSRVTRSWSTSARTSSAALRADWTAHHDTWWARATSLAARPDTTTAATNAARKRTVDLDRGGTCAVDSANVRFGHPASMQTCLLYTSDAADEEDRVGL